MCVYAACEARDCSFSVQRGAPCRSGHNAAPYRRACASSQALATVVWAFATLGAADRTLLRALSPRAQARTHTHARSHAHTNAHASRARTHPVRTHTQSQTHTRT